MTDAVLVSAMAELAAEIRGLRADLAGRQRGRLSAADDTAMAALLPILVAVVRGKVFAVADLAAHAALDVGADMRIALGVAGGPRKVGKLLRRADGHTIAGYRVDRVGADRAGALWTITTETRETRTD